MKKYFYTHIVDTSMLSLEIGGMDLTPKERLHLISLIDSNIHHEILDLILSELNPSENHSKVWRFLNEKIKDVEEKIKKTAEDIEKELHRDIKEINLVKM